jgi:hypothetical protein
MYHPKMGVWTIRDPAQQGLNLYENVKSNPVSLTDPTGLYVTARLQEDHIVMEVRITLWSPWERAKSEPVMTNIEENIHRGLKLLEQENPYKVCHKPDSKVYPIRWSANVTKSFENHWLLKPGNHHYVEVRRNPKFLGLFGPENNFTPSISPKNNQGGLAVWSHTVADLNVHINGQDYSKPTNLNPWYTAHEMMHMAGLHDEYNWLTGEPNKPYFTDTPSGKQITNIMAGYNENGFSFNLDQRQVETMLSKRLKESLGWTLGVDYVIVR